MSPRAGFVCLVAGIFALAWVQPTLRAAGPAPRTAPAGLPAPQWVRVVDERGGAHLTWIRSPAFAAVRVYRRDVEASGIFVPIAETRENSYLDTSVEPGRTYRYRLTGMSGDGRAGAASVEMAVRIGVVARTPPAPPEWEGYLTIEDGVGLKWSAREGEDVIAYNIYRASPPDTETRLVGSSRGTSFHDAHLEPGRRYVYTLTALDSNFRETGFSAELAVTFEPRASAAEPKKAPPTWRVRRTRPVALVTGGDIPFLRPADVAVGPVTGRVYVSDSGQNRVFVFSAVGTFESVVGAAKGGRAASFKRLLGLATDAEENLYAVDAADGSIQAFSLQGRPGRRIDLPRPAGGGATGFIDVAIGPDGRIFAIDNYNSLAVETGREGAPRQLGRPGALPGEFSAPTFCAVDGAGRLLVADCLNARVQVFSASGEFERSFGRAERGPGGFGRPKGVAVSAAGEIYVADSWLNTVQVFDAEGRFAAILGDEAGKPLDLGSPNGVALGAGNRIFIAERLAARLQIRELIDGTP